MMAGIATAIAELYARYNIPSIPLGKNKRPSVKGFEIAGLTVGQSERFIRSRPNANALGVPDGRLSGIVRLDIDEHGEHIEREVIRRAGDTPFKVETASRKRHLIYAYNGERRLTGPAGRSNARPWSDLKVDLCGQGGYSISPPSQCAGGEYRFLDDVTLEQMLENRHRLPVIKRLDDRAYVPVVDPAAPAADGDIESDGDDLGRVPVGDRDAVFYRVVARITKRVFLKGGSMADAHAEVIASNAEFPVPLADNEVRLKVKHWWGLTEAGKNRFGAGRRQRVRGWRQELAGSDPVLLALLEWLKDENGPESEFWIANGMIGTHFTGWWSNDRLRDARQRALKGKWIKLIVKPVQGRHALYRWGPTAMTTLFPSEIPGWQK
jgi:hypothetical protein